MSTNRVKLVVAYDGTDFRGWAAQSGRRTVQGTLKETVRRVSGEDCEIVGASRTDSGAHARGQVCHFDTNAPIADFWVRAINDAAPEDVRVVSAKFVPLNFHSRFCAMDREYMYRVLVGSVDPFRNRFAYVCGKELSISLMRQAADRLVGKHDFLAFTAELSPEVENTTRTLFAVDVTPVGSEIRIRIRGSAFLRGMMRRIAGGLVEVGLGKRNLGEFESLLSEKRDGVQWPVVLPAKGLTLMRVRYGRHPKDHRERTEPFDEEDDTESPLKG